MAETQLYYLSKTRESENISWWRKLSMTGFWRGLAWRLREMCQLSAMKKYRGVAEN